eukprot:TRINITY_DN17869_c0_g1_i2.p3 TRINITY_DN17869_c0_g1~~TRINITY_DN17869_c0_g1_i2.p3  ORF type:complete len:104 (+),score=29.36 TRINITY_DN17869_c0_g1_i2:168-479(+)
MAGLGHFAEMQGGAMMAGGMCCQRAFTWMWPEDYGDAPIRVHGEVGLSETWRGEHVKVAPDGVCTGQGLVFAAEPVSYTHLRAHETPEHLVCRLLLEKKKKLK